MQILHAREMRPQGFDQRGRKHRDPVLRAFAVADRDLPVAEIHVLHPKREALSQPQPRAVEQARHQPLGPFKPRKQRSHLITSQHHRHSHRALCALDSLHPGQLDLEHLPIEEKKR